MTTDAPRSESLVDRARGAYERIRHALLAAGRECLAWSELDETGRARWVDAVRRSEPLTC